MSHSFIFNRTWSTVSLFGVIAAVATGCGGGSAVPSSVAAVPQEALRSIPIGFDSVTRTFGAANVSEGDFSSPDTQIVPWTGYWFPKRGKELFASDSTTGELSPLQRYDRWVQKVKGIESHAADLEAQNYDPEAEAWEGLCNAWAEASIKLPNPVRSATVDGVAFRAQDLKALLIKTYDGKPIGFTQYGQRYEGTLGDDFLDIYPDQFHRFLQVQLFEKAQPFIMDKDPGPEVWNVPVYGAETHIAKDPVDTHVMHVTTWVTFANFVYTFDYNGGTKPVSIEYTYDLYGNPLANGTFEVHSGFWTKDSLENHPDFVTVLPDGTNRVSYNTYLNSQWVDEIVNASIQGQATTTPSTP